MRFQIELLSFIELLICIKKNENGITKVVVKANSNIASKVSVYLNDKLVPKDSSYQATMELQPEGFDIISIETTG